MQWTHKLTTAAEEDLASEMCHSIETPAPTGEYMVVTFRIKESSRDVGK